MNAFIVILLIAVGAALVIKSNWLVSNFGYSSWAEAKMGAWGGTRLLIKLIGIGMIVAALLSIGGLMDDILLKIFSPMM